MSFQFSKKSFNRMIGVCPDLIIVFSEALKNSLIDFGIPEHGGLRTSGVQNQLFQKKLSKCDGFEKISNHQTGNALDFYAYINGRASWDKIHLAIVASTIMTTAKRLKKEGKITSGLTWGGEFDSISFHGWDYPHIEINGII